MIDHAGRDVHDAGLRRPAEVTGPGAETLAAQQFGQPLGRPVALGDQDDPPALAEPLADVGEHARGIAAIGLRGTRFHAERGTAGFIPHAGIS
jgi:hypothetical protein